MPRARVKTRGRVPGRRRAVSEILAAIVMLIITVIGFALIAPSLIGHTQLQASQIISEYQEGAIKQGQFLTMIYASTVPDQKVPSNNNVTAGLLNYGTSDINIYGNKLGVFLFLNGVNQNVTLWQLTDVSSSTRTSCPWTNASCPLVPNHAYMLTAYYSSTNSPIKVCSLVLYSTDNLAYSFTC